MKLLLINPPISNIIDISLPEILLEEEDPMPPLGLMYLSSYLKKYTSHQVKILDCQIEKIKHQKLKKIIQQEKPDIVGITAMTLTLLDVLKTAKLTKKVNPKIKIVLGGPHIHFYPEETIKQKDIDYCILNEGEETLKELIENINQPEKLTNIKGLVFKQDNKIVNNGNRELIKQLDNLPFPDRKALPYQKYSSSLATQFPVTTMFTSRGCPFQCIFCNRPHLGKKFRYHNAKNVVDEMEECQKLGIKEILIYDDTFAVKKERVMEICSEIQKRKLKIAWDVRTRVDTVDESMLKAMKQAGCQRIHYGIEAGTEKILKVLRKGISLSQAQKVLKQTKKIGIQTLVYFMIGSPTETKQDILKTIKLAKKINPDYAHFAILTPYPGTDLYYLGLQQKILPYDYWKKFAENPKANFEPFLWEENLNKRELELLLKKAYRSFYLRPSYILKKILQLRSWTEFKSKFKAGLNMLKV